MSGLGRVAETRRRMGFRVCFPRHSPGSRREPDLIVIPRDTRKVVGVNTVVVRDTVAVDNTV